MGVALLFNGLYTSLSKASDGDLEWALQCIYKEQKRRKREQD